MVLPVIKETMLKFYRDSKSLYWYCLLVELHREGSAPKEIRLWWAFVQNTRILDSIMPFGSIPQNVVQMCKIYDGNNISSNVLKFRGESNRTKTFNACLYYTNVRLNPSSIEENYPAVFRNTNLKLDQVLDLYF